MPLNFNDLDFLFLDFWRLYFSFFDFFLFLPLLNSRRRRRCCRCRCRCRRRFVPSFPLAVRFMVLLVDCEVRQGHPVC